jgi:folate-binding Fe-S cluster repair protein YgfZ
MNQLETLQWRQIRVRGVDRLSYLQGQLTQDISKGVHCRSLLLQPSGEVLSDLEVAVLDDYVCLTVSDLLADAVLVRMRRFVLRVDVQFEDLGITEPPVELRSLVESAWPSAFEWSVGLPPHSYGQRVVDETVSFTKGCFTGQELVGRADARGATMPWRFIAGHGGDVASVEVLLKASGPEGPQGITSLFSHEGETHWRGVAHRSFDPSALLTRGAELTYFA